MGKIRNLFLICVLGLSIFYTGCRPDEEVFARPEYLAGPVYQQLQSMGEFNHYLECLDRTEYAAPLKTGGSWTAFVPTDAAFNTYLQKNGYSSVKDMPLYKVKDIVKYSLIIDAYNTTTLTFYRTGWYAGNSFRRYTLYQDSLAIVKGSENPNLIDVQDKDYLVDRSGGRRKTTNYWLDLYIDSEKNAVKRSDYTYMFPGEKEFEKSGDMRVFDAEVTQKEIVAENGLIYALDEVLEPRPNLYQNLSTEKYSGKYSMFKNMLDRFGFLHYMNLMVENPYTNSMDSLFQIRYNTGITNNYLAFNPNDEIMPKLLSNVDHTESNATGLLVPTNEALLSYLQEDNELAKNYSSYDDMPLDVLGIFLNTNFFTNYWSICPSHFGHSYNVGLEEVDIKEADVVETMFCSNGLFVGVNKVYPNNSFSTVYGPMVLDTTYSVMLSAIKDLGLDNALKGTGINFSILGVKNTDLQSVPDPNHATRKVSYYKTSLDYGVYLKVRDDPDPANNRVYPDPNSANPSSIERDYVKKTINDIVLNQIIEKELIEDNYYQTKKGEFAYYAGSQVQGGGNMSKGEFINLDNFTQLKNGKFYITNKFLIPPTLYTGGALFANRTTYLQFFRMLFLADLLLPVENVSGDYLLRFLDTRKSYTLFAPNNDAVLQAIADGVVPNPALLPRMNELEKATAIEQITVFAKKHFVQHPIPTDGKTIGRFNSSYVIDVVDFAPVYISYDIENDYNSKQITVRDTKTGEVLTTTKTGGNLNLLSKGVVIHEIDTYLNPDLD